MSGLVGWGVVLRGGRKVAAGSCSGRRVGGARVRAGQRWGRRAGVVKGTGATGRTTTSMVGSGRWVEETGRSRSIGRRAPGRSGYYSDHGRPRSRSGSRGRRASRVEPRPGQYMPERARSRGPRRSRSTGVPAYIDVRDAPRFLRGEDLAVPRIASTYSSREDYRSDERYPRSDQDEDFGMGTRRRQRFHQ